MSHQLSIGNNLFKMKQAIFLITLRISLIFAQDFLSNNEEISPEPLTSFGALEKCGEGEQKDNFVCVPYYNCDPFTNRVVEIPEVDGTNTIDIR